MKGSVWKGGTDFVPSPKGFSILWDAAFDCCLCWEISSPSGGTLFAHFARQRGLNDVLTVPVNARRHLTVQMGDSTPPSQICAKRRLLARIPLRRHPENLANTTTKLRPPILSSRSIRWGFCPEGTGRHIPHRPLSEGFVKNHNKTLPLPQGSAQTTPDILPHSPYLLPRNG